jgi:hypothetical protein
LILISGYKVPFRTYLSTQFSIAFDVYLAALAGVDRRVMKALGRDTPNWRLKNACPSCLYKLEGEPELMLPILTTMDGNNSLSRFGQMGQKEVVEEEGSDPVPAVSKARADDREVPGDYYLSREAVDIWAKEGLDDLMKGHDVTDPVSSLLFISLISHCICRNPSTKKAVALNDGPTCVRRSPRER